LPGLRTEYETVFKKLKETNKTEMYKLFLSLNCHNKIENENETLIDIKFIYILLSTMKILAQFLQ